MDLFPRKPRRILSALLPLFLLIAVSVCSLMALTTMSRSTLHKEQDYLEQALTRSAVACYSRNGYYPENLSDLLQSSGLTYDPETFVVEYLPSASNLMPYIHVIPYGQASGGSE